MNTRPRDYSVIHPLSVLCEKWGINVPLARMEEFGADVVDAGCIQTESVPGSAPEIRSEAAQRMYQYVVEMEPGQSVNREQLLTIGGLLPHNRSDSIFVSRWAKENNLLDYNPFSMSHFVKRLANGNAAANH
jgi:hypothetical protein